ncbi:unnamed protein product [Diatraea saccharalis]|uniref:Uncharacterized protein n=1 Tax=Diatraea saccharalis TaxID=40085 RepID=A0A9N9RB29_9NEOP|nr:unnamed protein product [Diatraea saccharalis]
MGYTLENCPVVYSCCGRVPLRYSCMFIAVLGVLTAALLMFIYSDAGNTTAKGLGVPYAAVKPMDFTCFVFGVLLCAGNILLLIATIYLSEALCELYVWFMLVYLLVFIVCGVALVVTMALADADKILVFVLFLIIVVYVSVSLYFTVVVANFRMTIP